MEAKSEVIVRYAETDKMGIVHHSNYYVWFELGRTEYCRQSGFSYLAMEDQDGLRLVVAESRCRYIAPAFYEDQLIVTTTVGRIRSRGLSFKYDVTRGDKLLATGETSHIVTSTAGKTTRLPEKYLKLLQA